MSKYLLLLSSAELLRDFFSRPDSLRWEFGVSGTLHDCVRIVTGENFARGDGIPRSLIGDLKQKSGPLRARFVLLVMLFA